MRYISHYQVLEKIYESTRSFIYRAQRETDQEPVLLKVPRQRYPSSIAIARFQREFDILQNLNIEGVIKTYGLEMYEQSPVLILEDFGGKSLLTWSRKQTFDLEKFLILALQITSILGEIHQCNLIHKDINPSNIVINPVTKKIKIIDFGIASNLLRENPALLNPNILEGTIAYLSPEQTGRVNRTIDYRTDFYALGVTFYQLLCDRLPFSATDALEMIHAHIARQPIPPHQINPVIPQPISEGIMKLLAKNAEDRYQSTQGIKADLQECLSQLQQNQQIASFSIGRRDISSTLQIPQKLYGREQEVDCLLEVFNRVSGNQNVLSLTSDSQLPAIFRSELVLISGYSGMGKTTLVQELYKPITQRQGYFISGKYKPLRRNIPYSGLIEAFRELIRQLLSESEAQIADWRERLLVTLGDNTQAIIDVIPDIELILGPQPEVIELPPVESKNRFLRVLEKFVRVFTQPAEIRGEAYSPKLIIFLDDLQWVDNPTLQLLQRWMTVFADQPLLIIGSYRENEVDASHPLVQAIADIRQAGGIIHSINLSALGLTAINALIQDTLHCDSARSLPLAELILQKTAGNPLFINEYLGFLYRENLINFDIHQGIWKWDLNQIQSTQLTDNVVEMIQDRILDFPPAIQQIIALAACIGSQFNLRLLTLVAEQDSAVTASHLRHLIQQNLIIALGDDHQYHESYSQSSEPSGDIDVIYRFSHDRIYQACYSLLSEADKLKYHLKIGQLLLRETAQDDLNNKIFQIVDHLNIGAELITEQNLRNELAQLNLIAGHKVQTAIAYESALNYFKRGRSLLAENSWQNDYGLTLALCESTAQAAYLAGDYGQMEQSVAEVLHHAQTPLDKTQVCLVKIQAYIAQDQFFEAIDQARQALALLDIRLPVQPEPNRITKELLKTKSILRERSLADLVHLPRMSDPQKLAAMQIIASICTPAYFLAPELWKLMVFQKIQLSLHYGNAPGSAFGYADYGMIQCAVEENIEAAYQFAQLAEQLQIQLDAQVFVPKTALLVNMYLKHWREHLKETLNPFLAAYECGLETGDLEYATFAIAFRFYHSYLVGRELNQLEQEIGTYEDAIDQFKQILPLALTRIYRQVVLNLIGSSETPWHLTGNRFNEAESLPQLIAANDKYLLFHLYLNKLILAYLFQNNQKSIEYVNHTTELLGENAVGLLVVPVYYFYDSLARIAIFPEVPPREQQKILQKVAASQKKMKYWAENAPMNYLHKFYLVEAERYRVLNQVADAIDAYDQAIELAQTNEYPNEAALANELAGRFYLARHKPKIAQTYLMDAYLGYLGWGATAKARDLEQRYPQFCDRFMDKSSTLMASQPILPPSQTTSSRTDTIALDFGALLKASQALSGEIVLDKLLAKLMAIMLENAGAQRGCLLLENQGQLFIEAESNVDLNSLAILQAIPLNSEAGSNRVSSAIVSYIARTQETVVLNSAIQDSRFSQDSYILNHQPKSILGTPLIRQGKLLGILYLENNLTLDAFTPDRLSILQILSTQAAISIDNARLYNQLESRVQQRTQELTQTNDRLQSEILERQRSEQTLRMIVEGTASVTGLDFFRSLVRSLAQALGVRYAFISECLDAVPTRVRSFAFWQGDEFGDEFEYDLPGTPCEGVLNSKGYQCFPAQIQALFPEEKAELEAMQAQSYAGIALLNSSGKLLGHLAILDDKPMGEEPRNQAVLEIFAARAATEMERQQAEEALRISEAKFSTAFRSSPEAITISTVKDGCYIEVNESCLRMLGYRQEEMIGRSAIDLGVWAKPEDRERVKQLLQKQGTVTNLEVKYRRKSGEIFPALFSAEVIHLEDQPCWLAVVADISMLKQAEKALARLAEIGELAAMIVHEVRNPLTTIAMGLNSFKRLQLSERFQEYLSLSLEETDRLQRLLNQILLYSRPQTLQRSQIELNSIISETLNTLKTIPAASGKNLKLLILNESVMVLADSDKLKQVLINLVTNAYEAVNEGQAVTVQIQTVVNHQVCIQIHNEGDPIPSEILPKLTQPFFTTKASGTGLGLAIVKRIVEAHEGEFAIESSRETGTLVKVYLPLVSARISESIKSERE